MPALTRAAFPLCPLPQGEGFGSTLEVPTPCDTSDGLSNRLTHRDQLGIVPAGDELQSQNFFEVGWRCRSRPGPESAARKRDGKVDRYASTSHWVSGKRQPSGFPD